MSYLNVPRLHFTGRFQADPSTVNNNDNNWDPATELSDDQHAPGWVYWNPNGTHNWIVSDGSVRGAATSAAGPFNTPASDPIIGARVRSAGTYPAKLVDLDPDNQCVSQIWGLQLEIAIPDPTDATKTAASVTASLPPTAFGDLWSRATNAPAPGMPTMSAVFQGVLQNVTWVNESVSPLLTQLKAVSPDALSIRFVVDSFQPDSNQSNFTFGRIVGTIGPVAAGEAPRSTPRRLAPVSFQPQPPPPPSIFSTYGAAGAAWDSTRGVLVLDLGNCVPTNGTPPATQPTVPADGWPINNTTLQLTIPGPSVSPGPRPPVKSGLRARAGVGAPSVLATIDFTLADYLTYAGIVEVPVSAPLASLLQSQPLTLTNTTNPSSPVTAVKEDALGRYVDVDVPFFRLEPGETGQVTLWATKFGQPWIGAELDVAPVPVVGNPPGGNPTPGPSQNGGPWPNGWPTGALTLSTRSVSTGSSGTGVLTLTASDPGTPRTYPDSSPGPDGQTYWITGSWANWGMIFLFPGMGITSPAGGAPINVLISSTYAAPANPTWDADVGPILQNYARLYPYMMGIVDIGDYETVKQNASSIQYVLNLPRTDPHHMPIVRDLSRDKLAMINAWFAQGMVK
jgi:hypothetical protein